LAEAKKLFYEKILNIHSASPCSRREKGVYFFLSATETCVDDERLFLSQEEAS
jgi:hypothetical protein